MPNRLKELRKQQKKTLDDIELETGIKRATYNRYENGQSEPKLETWQKLADYFDERIDYVMGVSDIPKSDVDRYIAISQQITELKQQTAHRLLKQFIPDYHFELADDDLKDIDPNTTYTPKSYLRELYDMVGMLSAIVYTAGVKNDEKADESIDLIFENISTALTDINERGVYEDVAPESFI